jgi:hypothetical protein
MKIAHMILPAALAILLPAAACRSNPDQAGGWSQDGGKALDKALAGIKSGSPSGAVIDLAAISPAETFSLAPAASTTVTPVPPPVEGGLGTVRISFLPYASAPNNISGQDGVLTLRIKNTGETRRTITLKRSGTSYTEADKGSLFYIGENAKLILEGNITLDGLIVNAPYDDAVNNNAPLLVVGKGGSLELGRGVWLTGNYAPAGGAVYIDEGGTGIQDGALITGNTAYTSHTGGAGVYVGPNGSYTLKSGEIKDNHTVNLDNETEGGAHGGGLWVSGVFVQSGGSIVNNSAPIHCGAIMSMNGSITLSGGVISGNRSICAPGIFLTGALSISGDIQLDEANPIEVVQGSVITQAGALTGTIPVSLFGGTASDWADKPVIVPAGGTTLATERFRVLATTSLEPPVPIPPEYALDTDGVFRRK